MPTLTVIGSRSVRSNCRLRSTSADRRRVTSASSSTATAGGATIRNSSGPERPRIMGSATAPRSSLATACSAWSPAAWPWFSLSSRKLSISTRAIVTGRLAARAASVSRASRPTIVPWLSVPVSASRRVDSISSAVWRVSRRWAVWKMRNSNAAAISAAVRVTITTSRRTDASRSRTGTASRQIPTTPRTLPSTEIGRYSRSSVDEPRRSGPASAVSIGRMAARAAPPTARPKSPPTGITSPRIDASLAATIVPSGRRSSTRRISPGRTSVASWDSSFVRMIGPVAGSGVAGAVARSEGRTYAFTKARVVAASLLTTSVSVAAEKCVPTMKACAAAVMPTSATKAPNTRMSSVGRENF